MNFDKRKYIYIAIAAILAVATLYVTYSLVAYGSPTEKSQNEYLIDANKLHNNGLYEDAVEPYMKASEFDKQRSLVNYNTATNSLMKNREQLEKSFTEEGVQLDSTVLHALDDATEKLITAGRSQVDRAKYSSIYHNIGVTMHMCDSITMAEEAYKEALRKNPMDEDARYNLAVILYQKKNEQQQQQQQQQNQKQNKEQQKKEEKKQEEKDKQEQEKQQEKQQQEQQQQQEQEEKEKIEQMLKALMQDEKDIREKMEKVEKVKVKGGYIEKNW